MSHLKHQYVERSTGRIVDETLYGDRLLNLIHSGDLERPHALMKALTSPWMTDLLASLHYDTQIGARLTGVRNYIALTGMDTKEWLNEPESYRSLRDIFERKIRYWECRPMEEDEQAVVSPADSRMLAGSFSRTSSLCLKGKFFVFDELLGKDEWLKVLNGGDFAVFRLTPDKYHYNHTPVAGRVADIYEIPGAYHSCNPGAVVSVATPYSKNKRVVTIIDTDIPGGTGVGIVAMIEVVALMIGDIRQCYSEERYDVPQALERGMLLKKGAPKSLYRPGSSTDVLLFQKGRICFCGDILRNMHRPGVESRFSHGFGEPLVETDVRVRSKIGESCV